MISMTVVELDWRAYFEEFRRAHGDPVPWKGRLLFQDGWQYSSTDHRGPEWPPPEDPREAWRLKMAWVGIREKALRVMVRDLREQLTGLRQAGHQRSCPLQRRASSVGEDGHLLATAAPLDLEVLEAELLAVEASHRETLEALEELRQSAPIPPFQDRSGVEEKINIPLLEVKP